MHPISIYASFASSVFIASFFLAKKGLLGIFRPWIGAIGAACALSLPQSFAQSSDPLADALEEIRTKHDLPGLIAGQFDTEKILRMQAVGFRRWNSTDPLMPQHPMHLGSCTKSMTATLTAMAVDQGLVSWNTRLDQVFTADIKVTSSRWANVTLEQLMHHTSGAPANPPWSDFTDPHVSIRDHRRNVLHWWMEQPRMNSPSDDGKEFLYSNLGYMTLGAVLEELRDQPWEDQIREHLFEPLQMRSAGFGVPSKSLGDNVPWGHIRSDGLLVHVDRDNPPALGPAGTVYANMEDWVRYLQLHLRRRACDTHAVRISEESFEYLHKASDPSSGPEGYAGGWNVIRRPWSNGPIYTHNGSNTYWYCVVFLAPQEGRGIFAACNLGSDAFGPCDQALQWMLKNPPTDLTCNTNP